MLLNSMVKKSMVKKLAALGVALGMVASPLAFGHSSIELNKDSNVGNEALQPESRQESETRYTTDEITREENNTLDYSPSSSRLDNDRGHRHSSEGAPAGYSSSELTQEEGNSLDW